MTLDLGPRALMFGAVFGVCTVSTLDSALGETSASFRNDIAALRSEIAVLRRDAQVLRRRVTQLESLYKVVVCGRVDSDRMKSGAMAFRVGCDPRLETTTPSVRDRLNVTLSRPGLFKFEFVPPRREKPIVIATAADRWGSIPVTASTLRISDVTEAGFTIQTFDAAETLNPANVDFFFAVLGESPLPAN